MSTLGLSPISVQDLTYYYPSKCALKDVSFSLEQGSITALVGPNGAGKSTLMRNLAGLDVPYSGQISICGIDVHEHPRLAHTKIGYLPDDFGLYDDLKVSDVLEFMGGCHNLTGTALNERITLIANTLHLNDVLTQKCGTLSRGWRQRVGIALATIHMPDILMLDEPASGLDPEARAELSHVLKNLQAQGMTILVSSHILAELEEYCTAMLVLRDGKIQDHVTLTAHQQSRHQTIRVQLTTTLSPSHERTLLDILSAAPPVIAPDKTSLQFEVGPEKEDHHALLKQIMALDIPVCSFTVEETSLQSLYLELAHKTA
ncbi:MAG: ABC transporter ATP-binding protein [Pseudobdellovibrionaceae bacterium]